MTLQKMDAETAFVHHFCTQLAEIVKGHQRMAAWYVLKDKRPGTIQERFEKDAADYAEYARLFKP